MKGSPIKTPLVSIIYLKFVNFLIKCILFCGKKGKSTLLGLITATLLFTPHSEAIPCRTLFNKAVRLIKPQKIGLEVEVIGLSHQKTVEKITELYPGSKVKSNKIEIKKTKYTEVETLVMPTPDAESRHIFNNYTLRHRQNESSYTLKGGHLSFKGKTINANSFEEALTKLIEDINSQDDSKVKVNIDDYRVRQQTALTYFDVKTSSGTLSKQSIKIINEGSSFIVNLFGQLGNTLKFTSQTEAESFVESVIESGEAVSLSTIQTHLGEINIVPENSNPDIYRVAHNIADYRAIEIVFPPVTKRELKHIYEILKTLNDSGAIANQEGHALGLHVNLEVDPTDVKSIQKLILNTHKYSTKLTKKYAQDKTREAYYELIPQEAIGFLESIPPSEITMEHLATYQKMLPNGKSHIINIKHLVLGKKADNYRPAVEFRFADSSLSPSQLNQVISDIFSLQ